MDLAWDIQRNLPRLDLSMCNMGNYIIMTNILIDLPKFLIL